MVNTQGEAINIFSNAKNVVPGGRVQWKGTDVCMDFDCACGEMFHVDGYFASSVECPECHRMYALDWHINVIEISVKPDSCHIVGST